MEIYQCGGRLHAINAAEVIEVQLETTFKAVAVRPQPRPAIR